jgi:predicted ATPase/class 3 adenylate cyclase
MARWQSVEQLYESNNALVYRGQRASDQQPVILKVLKGDYPAPEKIAWFKREFELASALKLPGVAQVYSLEQDQQRWVMAIEDFGGESLARLAVAGQIEVGTFLKLAIQITEILGQLHSQQVIHKDINPANILLNPATGQIKLIDFSIATRLSRENPTFRNPDVIEGTLAYISPEQTGRMNRAVDYRTDFYSLGATFYELLTGQVPFLTTDLLELVHAHIAKYPPAPHLLRPEIPRPLSTIVQKLLAKNAEERYQSARGLQADLEESLRQWQAHGRIEPFPLGQYDISEQFQIPQKLYGREQEVATLLAAFERASQGARELLLVSGHSGIGKSALVQEIYKPLTRQRGYFLAGKFDQFQRDIPYSALIQAFRSLVRQLLTESEEALGAWREQLQATWGPNGQIIVEVIPEVGLIVGPQPPVPALGPTETQNRFNLVFQSFIQVFARLEQPLVLFLDDLQWADSASLNLLRLVLSSADTNSLFVIGAYRANEVNSAHPLLLTLADIRQSGAAISEITLTPLEPAHISQLLADTLHHPIDRVEPLADLLLTKTGGNPFFLTEFLKALYAESLLHFDSQQGGWHWDLAQLQAHAVTTNVVELLADKVQQLPLETQQALKLGACIGNRFDLATLAIVAQKPLHQIAADLWQALVAGLVVPLSDNYKLLERAAEPEIQGANGQSEQRINGKHPTHAPAPRIEALTVEYKFAHDRVQHAIYSLIPETDRQAIHLRVGQELLRQATPSEREQRIFDIVSHLNQGRGLLTTIAERDEAAALNLLAGRRAKNSAAYQPAQKHFQVGLELLGPVPASWQRNYDLALALSNEAAEAAYLVGQTDQMEGLLEVVLQQAHTVLDKVQSYEIRMRGYAVQNKMAEAVKTGLDALKLLGISFPANPGTVHILQGLLGTKLKLSGKSIADLANLPPMTDPAQLLATRLLWLVGAASFTTQPTLFPLVAFKVVNISVKYGNAPTSPAIYPGYGLLLGEALGDVESCYQFGQLSLQLLEKLDARAYKARALMLTYSFTSYWKEHLQETLRPLLEGYQTGLETGDIEYATHNANTYSWHSFYLGRELAEIEREMASYAESFAQLKQETSLIYNQIYRQTILNLLGQSEVPTLLKGTIYDEEQMLPQHLASKNLSTIYWVYFNKMLLCYLFGEYQQAYEMTAQAQKYREAAMGLFQNALFPFYESLIHLALWPTRPKGEQKSLLKKVVANQKKLQKWANHAPMNFRHKWYLVEAERARLLDNEANAREYYDRAISLAHEYGYLNDEALAYELAARFYQAKGYSHLAHHYLREAHYAYLRWGALAKVKNLETDHPQVFAQARPTANLTTITTTSGPASKITLSSTTTTGQTIASTLDLSSVLKASQALSSEIELGKLLTTLITLVIENAGAQTGYLLLPDSRGQWAIQAQGSSDQADVTILQAIPVEMSKSRSDGPQQPGHTTQPQPESAPEQPLLPLSIIQYVARTKESLVLVDAARAGEFTRDPIILARRPKSVLCAPLLNQGKLTGIMYLENNLTPGAFTPDRLELLNVLSSQAAISIENATLYSNLEAALEQQVSLTNAYSRFVPRENLQLLHKGSILEVALGDQMQQDMTVFFSDIRDFTSLSEQMSPQENFNFINSYLGRVSPLIRQYGGFIDKYIGDAIMALFPTSAYNAVAAAVALQHEVNHYNQLRQGLGRRPIEVGVGLHCGRVMFGTVGEPERMEGTVISDAVNLASRLEGLNKVFGAGIIVSERMLDGVVAQSFESRFLGKVRVRGKTESVAIHEILDGNSDEDLALKLQTRQLFEKALQHYYARDLDQALQTFDRVLAADPGDRAADFHRQQIARYIEYGLPTDWDGVDVLLDK